MKIFKIRDYATSFTTLMFLVIGISGVMMFFHFYDKYVKELHEILGLVFVAAALFHVIANWKAMKNYFSKKVFLFAITTTIVVSSVFVINSLGKGENPKGVMMGRVLNGPSAITFQLLNGDYNKAVEKLKAQNIIVGEGKSISEIAKENKTSPFKIVSIVSSK
jgi:hypothetical protein